MRSALFAAENMEKESQQPGLRLQNSKLLKAELNGEVMARQGSMVAYQGQVQFQALGSGNRFWFSSSPVTTWRSLSLDLWGAATKTTGPYTALGKVTDAYYLKTVKVMGQADEALPVIIVRGLSWKKPATNAAELVRPATEDLFR